ncbi:WbqC family protein [Streptomyces pathocidini]|uniref:WbqC family protein n=1 Tax=Streptomyces pathocidini TaxID=1650571 RepID=A0ABW7UPM1_9ACTN|nr:WbqC family protein [Streptomyces pathocidini]
MSALRVRSCAIHQPNLLPRLSTLAKLYAADIWVVLDDVQFVRRDYQHRARLAVLDNPQQYQWLSVETHLPHGRATLIRDAQLAYPQRAARRLGQLPAQHYRASPYWQLLHTALEPVARTVAGDRRHRGRC